MNYSFVFASVAVALSPVPCACAIFDCWAFELDEHEIDFEVLKFEPENWIWEPLPCWLVRSIDDLAGENMFDISR